MALALGYLAGYLSGGRGNGIRQQIINSIDITEITNIFSSSYAKQYAQQKNVQGVEIHVEPGCMWPPGSDVNINLKYSGTMNVYWETNQSMSSQSLSQFTSEISNQLEATLNELNAGLSALFDGFTKDTYIDQEIFNEMKRTIQTNITNQTIAEHVAEQTNEQTVVLRCNGPLPSSFRVDIDAQQNLIIYSVIESSLDAIISNETITKWVNDATADLTQINIDPLAIFLIVIAIVVVVVGVALLLFFFVFKKPGAGTTSKILLQQPQTAPVVVPKA